MNISTKSVIITFLIVFFVSALFLGASPPAMQKLPDNYRAGRVLGVSEAMANRSFSSLGYELPKNDFRPLLPPEKNGDNQDFDLDGCFGATIDGRTGTLMFGKEEEKVVPIASITKLITALVFVDTKPNWDSIYRLQTSDRINGGRIYLLTGEEVRIKDLFYLSLVASANTATRALVSSTGMSEEEFVAKMNEKAKELGLQYTSFVDPVGLSNFNVSTAVEVAKIADTAFKNKYIQEATLTDKYEFDTVAGRKKTAYNTDILLGIFPENNIKIVGGKTGYTSQAGYCFVGKFVDDNGDSIVSVVLGGPSKNSRFHETRNMVAWAYDSFNWHHY